MNGHRLLAFALVGIVGSAALTGAAEGRPWTLADIAAYRVVTAVALAPRGDRLLYGVAWVDPKTHEDRQTWYLRSVEHADDAPLVLPPKAAPSDPAFSPSGDALAWIDDDRLWRYDLATRRVRALTGTARVVRSFAWAPDGTRIATTEQAKPPKAAPAPSLWLDPLASGVATTHPQPLRLWIVDAVRGTERPLATTGSFGGEAAVATPVWFADGRRLAIGRQPTGYYADYERLGYVVIDARTGTSAPVSTASGVLPNASAPVVGAAGRIAYVRTADGTTSGRTDVYVRDGAGNARDVSAALDRDFWSCGNSRLGGGGGALIGTALDGIAMRLYRLDGAAPRALTPADRSVQGFSVAANGRIAYVASAPATPGEVFVMDADGTHARRVTHASKLPAGVDVAPTTLLRTTAHDGHVLVAQLTRPRGGAHVPLVVELHGGPQCSDDLAFSPTAQWFATNGYAFLRPNPRGSDGYGAWSYKAIVGDWGIGPFDDVRATVESALAGGALDAKRMFVEGASYGGYLTSWTVTHDDDFRAAVAAFPVVDLMTDQGLSRSPGILRRFFGPTPLATAADRDKLRAQSPTTFGDALHTPLLLMAGLHDAQAPYPQTIAFYHTLHEGGKNVRMLVYPDAGHGPSDTTGYLDYLAHIAGWFAAHGGPRVPGAMRPPNG